MTIKPTEEVLVSNRGSVSAERAREIKRRLHDIANGITLRECADSDAHFLHDLADNLAAIQQTVSECSGGGAGCEEAPSYETVVAQRDYFMKALLARKPISEEGADVINTINHAFAAGYKAKEDGANTWLEAWAEYEPLNKAADALEEKTP